MDAHEKWLRDNGFGSMIDDKPEWKKYCVSDGNNMDEVCPGCPVRKQCEEFMRPLAEYLEKNCKVED